MRWVSYRYARSVSGVAHDDEEAGTHFYGSIEHRHQHVERELETRERRDDLDKRLGGGRARRRARPGEEVVDGRASGVAHRRIAGRRRRQRGLVEGGCLHHRWSIEVVMRVVAVADGGRDGASQSEQRQARSNPIQEHRPSSGRSGHLRPFLPLCLSSFLLYAQSSCFVPCILCFISSAMSDTVEGPSEGSRGRGRGRGKSRGGLGKYLRARGRGRGRGRPAEFGKRLALEGEEALELDEEEQKEYERELHQKYGRRQLGTNTDRYVEPEPELDSEGLSCHSPSCERLSEVLTAKRPRRGGR